MKFFAAILLTALLSLINGFYFYWWGIAIAALLVAVLVHQKAGKAFLSGFIGVFILWSGLAWWMDMANNGVLSVKIAKVLPLGGSSIALILVTGLIGGLVGGMAGLSGSYLRSSPR